MLGVTTSAGAAASSTGATDTSGACVPPTLVTWDLIPPGVETSTSRFTNMPPPASPASPTNSTASTHSSMSCPTSPASPACCRSDKQPPPSPDTFT
jgi:hypothetical protein